MATHGIIWRRRDGRILSHIRVRCRFFSFDVRNRKKKMHTTSGWNINVAWDVVLIRGKVRWKCFWSGRTVYNAFTRMEQGKAFKCIILFVALVAIACKLVRKCNIFFVGIQNGVLWTRHRHSQFKFFFSRNRLQRKIYENKAIFLSFRCIMLVNEVYRRSVVWEALLGFVLGFSIHICGALCTDRGHDEVVMTNVHGKRAQYSRRSRWKES